MSGVSHEVHKDILLGNPCENVLKKIIYEPKVHGANYGFYGPLPCINVQSCPIVAFHASGDFEIVVNIDNITQKARLVIQAICGISLRKINGKHYAICINGEKIPYYKGLAFNQKVENLEIRPLLDINSVITLITNFKTKKFANRSQDFINKRVEAMLKIVYSNNDTTKPFAERKSKALQEIEIIKQKYLIDFEVFENTIIAKDMYI